MKPASIRALARVNGFSRELNLIRPHQDFPVNGRDIRQRLIVRAPAREVDDRVAELPQTVKGVIRDVVEVVAVDEKKEYVHGTRACVLISGQRSNRAASSHFARQKCLMVSTRIVLIYRQIRLMVTDFQGCD